MVTPHMALLAKEMAVRGHAVSYVAEQSVDSRRAALGWSSPDLPGVSLKFVTKEQDVAKLFDIVEPGAIHLTQGFRSNGLVSIAQREIRKRKHRHFILTEAVDLRGPRGFLKPAMYSWKLQSWRGSLNGVLAIGASTPEWLRRLGPRDLKIFPFAYFLGEPPARLSESIDPLFRFLFVGALIKRKRVDLMLRCLGSLANQSFEVEIIGDGPMRTELEEVAKLALPNRVRFHGVLPMSVVPNYMSSADRLVLPSAHDGWGAVVSEAIMMGTPVICSAACGASEVVEASRSGGVFSTFDQYELTQLLANAVNLGKLRLSERETLRSWGGCLGARSGAAYLEALIMAEQSGSSSYPSPPWKWELETVQSECISCSSS